MNRRNAFAIAALATVGLAVACSDDNGTDPNKPATIEISSATTTNNQVAGVGKTLTNQLKVQVSSSSGKRLQGKTITWAVSGSNAANCGIITPTSSTTDAQGEATATWTLGATPGTCTATASVSGISAPVTFTATALESFSSILNGANERPTANNSPATGTAYYTYNPTTKVITYEVNVNGITGGATTGQTPAVSGAHIHGPCDACSTTGIIVDFVQLAQSATNQGFSDNSYTPVLTGTVAKGRFTSPTKAGVSQDSLLVLLRNGKAYTNVHATPLYGGGEIRGTIVTP